MNILFLKKHFPSFFEVDWEKMEERKRSTIAKGGEK